MLSKFSTLLLATVLLLINTQAGSTQPNVRAGDNSVRNRVLKLGPGAKVTVFLKDGTKVRGSISQILDDSFDVTLMKQTQSSIISYRDVETVKRRGWTNSAKIALGVAIGAGIIVGVVAAMVASADFGDINIAP